MLLFVSSTFTDTPLERDLLVDEILFDLREMATPHQIQVIFVDMRWGVRDENSCDHKTWVECADMLHWCKEESTGLFFLSFHSGKYGYTPLPLFILKWIMDRHLTKTECSEEIKELIFKWYILDENALPNRYVLKNLSDKDDEEYWAAFKTLLPALQGIAFDEQHPSLLVGNSVTSYEVEAAFDSYPVELADKERSFLWSHRQLSGEVTDRLFRDVEAGSSREESLKGMELFMYDQFPPKTIRDYEPLALSDLQSSEEDNNEKKKKYMEQCKSFLTAGLMQSLELIIAEKKQWEADGNGLGYPGEGLTEALHHSQWAHAKCSDFCGRTALVAKAVAAIIAPHRDAAFKGKFDGINLCIIGVSGAG
jgi:hypothetical protein